VNNFITSQETNRRIALQNREAMDKAVEEINKIIRLADGFPIAVPRALFTDNNAVKWELLRKLREDSHWVVEDRAMGPIVVPVAGGAVIAPPSEKNYYLYHKDMRREEVSK
jgi:hypothetical protein